MIYTKECVLCKLSLYIKNIIKYNHVKSFNSSPVLGRGKVS